MIKKIDSIDNLTFKHYKKLLDKKYRNETGEFLIEGKRLINEAINQGIDLYKVITYKEDIANYYDKLGYDVVLLKDTLFNKITQTVNSQGLIAAIKKVDLNKNLSINLEKIISKSKCNILFLDKIQDPGNLGTIIRSAHAFNIDIVILRHGSCELYLDKVLRSTMGSIFKVNVLENEEISILESLQNKGFKLYLTDVNENTNLKDITFTDKNIIVIGNEGNGVSLDIKNLPHEKLNIPMPGHAESLNASVAASIVMYELIR